jgi:hypothetical protein
MLAQQEAVDFLKQEIEVLQVAVVQGENEAARAAMAQLIIGSAQL